MYNQLNNSGSLQEQLGTPDIGYEVKGDDRILAVLVKEFDKLKRKVSEIEITKIIDETQLPRNILEENNMLPRPRRKLKRGRGYRPILKSEILEAKSHSVSEGGAARWMGISFDTYKRYAKLYDIYDPKPTIKGKRGIFDPNRGKYPLNEILQGKHPNVSIWTVKDKLLRSGIKKLECEVCGYNQRRLGDNKLPLLLNHMDDDIHNHKLENLKIMCFNCTFVAGRGYVRRTKFTFDPDWMQNAYQEELGKTSRY